MTECLYEPIEVAENGETAYRCATCGHERSSQHPPEMLHRQCEGSVSARLTAKRRMGRGPGTHLERILRQWLRISITGNCACRARAALMDRRGPAWSRANLETIVGWMLAEAKRRKYPAAVRAVGRPVLRHLVLLAIRRAERPPPLRVGFISPGLLSAGAEWWMVSLAAHLGASRRVDVVGIGVTNGRNVDPPLRQAASVPIVTEPGALARLGTDCDVIVSWGLVEPRKALGGYAGRLVTVAQGPGPWATKTLRTSKADHLVGVSEVAAVAAPNHQPITVIYNGADPERCRATVPRWLYRQRLGVRPGEKLVVYVGRIVPGKGIELAAKAIARLGMDWRLAVMGRIMRMETLEATVKAYPALILLPPVGRVGTLLHAADCFVLASALEGHSLALTEAWLCGVPSVATRVGAVPELERQHGDLCVSIQPEATAAEVADALRLAVSPEGRRLAKHAKAVAQKHYTVKAMAARWEKYLLGICRAK